MCYYIKNYKLMINYEVDLLLDKEFYILGYNAM
jgi:hypothetical protein